MREERKDDESWDELSAGRAAKGVVRYSFVILDLSPPIRPTSSPIHIDRIVLLARSRYFRILSQADRQSLSQCLGQHDGMFVRIGLLLPFLLLSLFALLLSQFVSAEFEYQEQLNLHPLPLGALLASFNFQSNQSISSYDDQNFSFFPRALGQILQHTSAKELHLRFSTGRWNADAWGKRPWQGTKEGATGVELWAWIEAESDEESFRKWTTLTQSLSGLFCASLNFIDGTRTTRPVATFSKQGDHGDAANRLRLLHGVLPGEVVCTENLTPFLKLLPCKGKAGIGALLDGHTVFDAAWQSMAIDTRPVCPLSSAECHMEISQTIDMTLDIERAKRPRDKPIPRPVPADQLVCDESKPYHSQDTCYPRVSSEELAWSIEEVFGRKIPGACPLIEDDWKPVCLHVPHERKVYVPFGAFEVKSPPHEKGPQYRCYHFRPEEEFSLEVRPQRLKTPYPLLQEPIKVERTMIGHGAAEGGIRTILENRASSGSEPVELVYFETLPWFMRTFVHTLKAQTTSLLLPSSSSSGNSSVSHRSSTAAAISNNDIVKNLFYRPAIDRERGTQLEVHLSIPAASTVSLTYDFEKAILRYTEYPPDANRGFNVAPAIVKVLPPKPRSHLQNEQPNEATREDIITAAAANNNNNNNNNNTKNNDHRNTPPFYIRTSLLLLPLPTPDFSMPYNVIILTSTVIALTFGSIFNLLVRRFVGVDEVSSSSSSSSSSLLNNPVATRFLGPIISLVTLLKRIVEPIVLFLSSYRKRRGR